MTSGQWLNLSVPQTVLTFAGLFWRLNDSIYIKHLKQASHTRVPPLLLFKCLAHGKHTVNVSFIVDYKSSWTIYCFPTCFLFCEVESCEIVIFVVRMPECSNFLVWSNINQCLSSGPSGYWQEPKAKEGNRVSVHVPATESSSPFPTCDDRSLLPPVLDLGKEEPVKTGLLVPIRARSGKQNLFHVVPFREFIFKNELQRGCFSNQEISNSRDQLQPGLWEWGRQRGHRQSQGPQQEKGPCGLPDHSQSCPSPSTDRKEGISLLSVFLSPDSASPWLKLMVLQSAKGPGHVVPETGPLYTEQSRRKERNRFESREANAFLEKWELGAEGRGKNGRWLLHPWISRMQWRWNPGTAVLARSLQMKTEGPIVRIWWLHELEKGASNWLGCSGGLQGDS